MNEKVALALNKQINMELGAFYTYLSMAAYLEAQNLPGFAAWMRHHSEEEMGHAMRIYNYVIERRSVVKLEALNGPKIEWKSVIEVFEDALRHEQAVTASIYALVELALSERDHATNSFLQWFVNEQVEEESVVDTVLQKLNRVRDFAPGLFMLDREFAQQAG